MSVIVQNLSKQFGQQMAVNNISFEAHKGEILGFLGPNGAGKTTTMKMITCYQQPTAGRISVCGFDTQEASMEVRKRIGYLPEHNPLYKDMYVREYLYFIAGLHGLDNKVAKVEEMIERTGLTKERKKIIGSLSKGYRQRVGLAQAMLHEPEVLILDEPMSGLDPNQIIEIRQLIRSLAQNKTVIFSSHDMPEVEQLCHRIMIIKDGVLVANDVVGDLQQRVAGNRVVTVAFTQEVKLNDLKKIAKVQEVKDLGQGRYQLFTSLEDDIRPAVFQFAVSQQKVMIELREETFSVEDVFQRLTQNA
jgi:ABC-2 type transport system ATP-binding protein